MKRNLIIALLMAVIAIPASAQFKWGVEAGLNMNKLTTSNMSDHKLGFFVGPKAQFSLLGLIVDGSIQYSQCQYIVDSNTENESFFVIPVNVKYAIGLGSLLSIYASTGPQWSWHVGNSHDTIKQHQLSWNVGVGVHLAKHFQVGVNYNIGCTDATVGSIAGGIKSKNNIWQVRAAYMF